MFPFVSVLSGFSLLQYNPSSPYIGSPISVPNIIFEFIIITNLVSLMHDFDNLNNVGVPPVPISRVYKIACRVYYSFNNNYNLV